jgi:hypothetical protein
VTLHVQNRSRRIEKLVVQVGDLGKVVNVHLKRESEHGVGSVAYAYLDYERLRGVPSSELFENPQSEYSMTKCRKL